MFKARNASRLFAVVVILPLITIGSYAAAGARPGFVEFVVSFFAEISPVEAFDTPQPHPTPPTTAKGATNKWQRRDHEDTDGAIDASTDVVQQNIVSTGAPELVTVTTYPFSSSAGISLEDMSAGTTQINITDVDDGSSASLSSIGFDFWFDGLRFTQFGVNANGFLRLGQLTSATGINIWQNENFASTANSPKR